MKMWIVVIFLAAISLASGQSCHGTLQNTCTTCSIGLTYCQESMNAFYTNQFYPSLDTITSSSCTDGSQCSTSTSCPQGGCNAHTVTWRGTCNGVQYQVSHTSCCQITS